MLDAAGSTVSPRATRRQNPGIPLDYPGLMKSGEVKNFFNINITRDAGDSDDALVNKFMNRLTAETRAFAG